MAAIDTRYARLEVMPLVKLQQIAGKYLPDKGRLIVMILQREFDKVDYDTWAANHGQAAEAS